MNIDLRLGDCLEVLKTIPDNSVDSIVTDPPYGIGFMNKEWDSPQKHKELIDREAKRSQERFEEGKSPVKGGFSKGVQPGLAIGGAKEGRWFQEWCELWVAECFRVLKPGGHLLSFSAPRTYHRMATAFEEVGFQVRDQIMWVFGSGFPKSHNIGKAIDKRGGESIGWFGEWLVKWRKENNIPQSKIAELFPSKTGGLTGCVSNWELGNNLPTNEQFNKICEVFNLPFKSLEEAEREFIGTKTSGIGKAFTKDGWGSGHDEVEITKGNSEWEGWGTALKPAHEPICMARKPLSEKSIAENVLKWGTGGINIDESRIPFKDISDIPKDMDKTHLEEDRTFIGNKGLKPFYYEQNTEGRFPANIMFDEEAGKLLDEQSGNIKGGKNMPPYQFPIDNTIRMNSSKQINRKGYEDNGGASRFFYCPKTSKKERGEGNVHPTVKPIALMEYLIKLVTPKGGVVLEPFMGSGSTGVAAIKNGFSFIGIEKEPEYFDIANQRISNYDNVSK